MTKFIKFGLPVFVFFFCMLPEAAGKVIRFRHYKFTITLPDRLAEIRDSTGSVHERLFFDTSAGIILMISARQSKFKSVQDYIDCSREGLETQLRNDYEDSTLMLISCNKPQYYPDKTNILHFQVSVLPKGFDTYMIYFIHHRRRDIQIAFTYKKENESICQFYIDDIMKSLRLN